MVQFWLTTGAFRLTGSRLGGPKVTRRPEKLFFRPVGQLMLHLSQPEGQLVMMGEHGLIRMPLVSSTQNLWYSWIDYGGIQPTRVALKLTRWSFQNEGRGPWADKRVMQIIQKDIWGQERHIGMKSVLWLTRLALDSSQGLLGSSLVGVNRGVYTNQSST